MNEKILIIGGDKRQIRVIKNLSEIFPETKIYGFGKCETEFKEKQQLVVAGIMQPWEFRAWYFGETEEEAKGKVQQDDLYGKRSEE